MALRHSITLELTEKFTPERLKEFANAVPENADITTTVNITPKDRPWESEVLKVSLTAEWTTE